MKAVVWSKTTCPFCVKAKDLLKEHNVEYEERNILTDWSKDDLLAAVPNARTVPQIFIDEKLIGGYNDLVDYFNNL